MAYVCVCKLEDFNLKSGVLLFSSAMCKAKIVSAKLLSM